MNAVQALLVCLLVACARPVAGCAEEVQLLWANSRKHGYHGQRWQTVDVEVVVQNIAFAKEVKVHYKDAGEDKVFEASHKRQVSDALEVWRATLSRNLMNGVAELDMAFKVEYKVNGMTFWDDNDGNLYTVAAGAGEITPRRIVFDYANAFKAAPDRGISARFSAGVILRNLAFEKNVQIHYTLDNWATKSTKAMTYQSGRTYGYSYVSYPNVYGNEYWTYFSSGAEFQDSSVTEIKFKFSYTVAGGTYWDDNHGAGYTTTFQAI